MHMYVCMYRCVYMDTGVHRAQRPDMMWYSELNSDLLKNIELLTAGPSLLAPIDASSFCLLFSHDPEPYVEQLFYRYIHWD